MGALYKMKDGIVSMFEDADGIVSMPKIQIFMFSVTLVILILSDTFIPYVDVNYMIYAVCSAGAGLGNVFEVIKNVTVKK